MKERRDRLQDRRFRFDLREQRDERLCLEAVLLADAGNEGVDVGARGIECLGMHRLRMAERKRERNRKGAGDAAAGAGGPPGEKLPCHVETSLRREWTAMRIPNPAMRVTNDVPPYLTSGSGTPTTCNSPATMPLLTNA